MGMILHLIAGAEDTTLKALIARFFFSCLDGNKYRHADQHQQYNDEKMALHRSFTLRAQCAQ